MSIFLHDAIRNVDSSIGNIIGDTVDNVVCENRDGNSVTIDKTAVTTEMSKLQKAHDDLVWKRNRQLEYPDWGTQLNKIYDDGIAKWKSEMVDPIKAKYPKPE